MQSNFRHTAESVRRDVENMFGKVGILCRVFGRGKDPESLDSKLKKEPGKYSVGGRLIQDAIGVRVVLYFEEDVEIAEELIRTEFKIDHSASAIDKPKTDQFAVTRHNLVCKIPDSYLADVSREIRQQPIDSTFEIQLRSVLSEGWHEVDHDLRYKLKEGWKGHDDLSRALNGILATIETSEWTLKRIFDDLAYRHYKNRNWVEMLHMKARMRTAPTLSNDLKKFLDDHPDFSKDVFRFNRKAVIQHLFRLKPSIPVSLDNILFVWNLIDIKNDDIISMTPEIIRTALSK